MRVFAYWCREFFFLQIRLCFTFLERQQPVLSQLSYEPDQYRRPYQQPVDALWRTTHAQPFSLVQTSRVSNGPTTRISVLPQIDFKSTLNNDSVFLI